MLKKTLAAFSILLLGIAIMSFKSNHMHNHSIYDVQINSLMGEPIDLSKFKDKKMLFVNVASECGFTPQYEELQQLHKKYANQLVIIGVPCNQFGGQEPGDAEEISSFCKKNYGVTFLLTEKVDVKGPNAHPLYKWLTEKHQNGVMDSEVKWNFQKYLVGQNGHWQEYFSSKVKPLSAELTAAIEK